jgi:hypothetical protein
VGGASAHKQQLTSAPVNFFPALAFEKVCAGKQTAE